MRAGSALRRLTPLWLAGNWRLAVGPRLERRVLASLCERETVEVTLSFGRNLRRNQQVAASGVGIKDEPVQSPLVLLNRPALFIEAFSALVSSCDRTVVRLNLLLRGWALPPDLFGQIGFRSLELEIQILECSVPLLDR